MNSIRSINQQLFRKESIVPLVIFRILFGFLMMAESFGAIFTGWVKEVFVSPKMVFPFFGFEWTEVLVGEYMYLHYSLMGVFALFFALGYRYRFFAMAMAVFWSLSYFMQKNHYNNHYYLMVLLCWFMVFVPANRFFSLDTKQNRIEENIETLFIYRLWFLLQILVVYTYAAFAKLYPSWLSGDFFSIRLYQSANWFKTELGWERISEFLQNNSLHVFMAYSGFFYDLLVVPFLIWKRTRWLAIFASLFFHLFNSITLQIGVFPFLALAMIVFVFPPKGVANFFFKIKDFYPIQSFDKQKKWKGNLVVFLFFGYFIVQILLPLRHYLIPQPVLWTEEGHRLSWRMMLRSKSAYGSIKVETPGKKSKSIVLSDYLTQNQVGDVLSKPDITWAFARKLEKIYKENDIYPIKVFVDSKISINGSDYYQFTNPEVDLLAEDWKYFGHQTWLKDVPKELHPKIYF